MTTNELKKLFESFNKKKVLIIGDVMIDAYMMGSVERISPEAPVPVVLVNKKENRMGGAANVALNIQALGATPLLCSVTGDDEAAELFTGLLKKNNMRVDGILRSRERITTVKTRVIGSRHQMMRIDEESENDLSVNETKLLTEKIIRLLSKEKIDVLIFEDYDKGVITSGLIQNIVRKANELKIPVSVDPKRKNFSYYKHVTLFKPNLREFQNGLKTELSVSNLRTLKKTVSDFQKKQNIEIALVTLSEAGMLVSAEQKQTHIPAHIRSIADVSGAGDTVISVASLCLAAGMNPEVTAHLANLAGGLVCEKSGVVPVEKNQLFEEAIRLLSKK